MLIKKLSIFVLVVISMACVKAPEKNISIKNTSKFDYVDKVISMSWEQVKNKFTWVNEDNFKIINTETKAEIPYQIEYLGTQNPANLLLQISLKSKEELELLFLQEIHSEFVTKTYGRYVSERYDDFAWENDKIAFRMYGKALEERPSENAYGIDVWVKRTDKMVINERYKRGRYHQDMGDGMDYYHVGFTLGAGNCAPYVNDTIRYSKNYTKWEVLDNGPLRTTFKLYFDSWNVAGKSLTAVKTISLDAGSQLNKIEVEYNSDTNETISVAIGIIKRKGESSQLLDSKKGILAYWEPTHNNDGTSGIGVFTPSKVKNMIADNDEQLLTIIEEPLNKPFIYYTGAAWDKAGAITSSQEWFDYLEEQRQKLLDDGIKIIF